VKNAHRNYSRIVGYSYPIPVTSGPVIRPQFRLTLDYTPGCRIALNVPKQHYAV
jgi:hypothetical protein